MNHDDGSGAELARRGGTGMRSRRAARRRFLEWALAAPLFGASIVAHAQGRIEEGLHYQRLTRMPARLVDGRIEVIDFFWYGCPHCNNLLPYLQEWKRSLPDDVEYRHVPAALNPPWQIHARAYYVAEALGVAERTHMPMFDAIHRDRRRLNDEKAIAAFFGEHGGEPQRVREVWNSFAVQAKLNQAMQLSRTYRIQGVPSLVIAGTFVTSPSMTGSGEGTIAVVDHLIERVRRGDAPVTG